MNVNLRWAASTALDLDHYELHFGRASGVYDVVLQRTNTEASLQNLADGVTWYFALKAVDATGNKSAFSNEISRINKFVKVRA